jgi:hypothetical protein
MTGHEGAGQSHQHPDTTVMDRLTAFLNRESEPSGGDAVALMMELITASGRPLLTLPTMDVEAAVTEDRHGLYTATITIGGITIRVFQPVDGSADVCLDPPHGYGEPYQFLVTTAGRPVLGPVPLTMTRPVVTDPRLAQPDETGHG